jgi:hypothetical protein
MPARHWEVIVQASAHVFVVVLHTSMAATPPPPMQLAVVRHSTQRIVVVLH